MDETIEFENLTVEVYEDLRAAITGGNPITLDWNDGPPKTVNGVTIHEKP